MKKTAIATAAVIGLVLTGCGGGGTDEAAAPGPAPTVTVTVTVTAEPELHDVEEPLAEDTEPAESEPADDGASAGGVSAFGETVTLPDGEGTITISEPQPFTPSDSASTVGEWDEFVVMDVTEVNDSQEPQMAGWSITATTGSYEAEQIFDSAQDVGSPSVDVMPGKSIQYKIAFGRNAGEDFVLQAMPLAGWNSAYFQ